MRLYKNGRVLSLDVEEGEDRLYIHARAKGSGYNIYQVELVLDWNGEIGRAHV